MSCDWAIRPFTDRTEVRCEKDHPQGDQEHEGVVRDYAYPGSETKISWLAGDRREFEGNWPGFCMRLGSTGGRQNCTLPATHHGRCAA